MIHKDLIKAIFARVRPWKCAVEIVLLLGSAWCVIFIILLLMFSSCRSVRYVEVPRVSRDTLRVVQVETRRDSVRDSIFLREFVRGDTVYRVKYIERLRWRDRWRVDTVQAVRVDSVGVPYPVERKVSRWNKVRYMWRGAAVGLVLVAVAVAVVWLRRRYR